MPTPVVAAVIRRDEQYLVCQRPSHKRHGGLFEFPGGKVDQDETAQEALIREMREELGVEVIDVGETIFSFADPDSQFVIYFLPTELYGDPAPLEHERLLWCTPPELRQLPLAPADFAFVTCVIRDG
jgi:mutator protein MutT